MNNNQYQNTVPNTMAGESDASEGEKTGKKQVKERQMIGTGSTGEYIFCFSFLHLKKKKELNKYSYYYYYY